MEVKLFKMALDLALYLGTRGMGIEAAGGALHVKVVNVFP